MEKLRGSFTALVTPMHEDGSIDYESWRNLIRFQLEGGITGLVPLGTTGETPTLDENEEEVKMISILMEEVAAYQKKQNRKIPVIIGASSNATRDAVAYVSRAKEAGADYALVVTPYYNKPSDEGIFRHFEAVSKCGIPIIVYNIAGRTGKNISTELLMRIAELPNIAGVKEASGSMTQIMEVIEKIASKKPGFSVLSGDDIFTLPVMAAGGDGVISVLSNLMPNKVAALVDALLKEDMAEARSLHYSLAPLFRAMFVDGNPASVKYAMKLKGLLSGMLRLPLVEVNDGAKAVIESAMRDAGLL